MIITWVSAPPGVSPAPKAFKSTPMVRVAMVRASCGSGRLFGSLSPRRRGRLAPETSPNGWVGASCKGPGRDVLDFDFWFLNVWLSYSARYVQKGRRILQNIRISFSLRYEGLLHISHSNRYNS